MPELSCLTSAAAAPKLDELDEQIELDNDATDIIIPFED